MKPFNYLLIKIDSESPSRETPKFPVAIFHGTDIGDAVNHIILLIAKVTASESDIIADMFLLATEKKELIEEILNGKKNHKDSIVVGDSVFALQSITIYDEEIDDDSTGLRYKRELIFDEMTGKFIDESNLADDALPDTYYEVDLISL